MASTISAGVGRSGSPMPRLITSAPAARSAAILRSSSANAYGGMRSRRLLGFIQLPPHRLNGLSPPSGELLKLAHELLAQKSAKDGQRPACQVYAQLLVYLYLELATVEHNRDPHRPGETARSGTGRGGRRGRLFERVGNRGAACAGAAREGLPHPALEDTRPDAVRAR